MCTPERMVFMRPTAAEAERLKGKSILTRGDIVTDSGSDAYGRKRQFFDLGGKYKDIVCRDKRMLPRWRSTEIRMWQMILS